MNPIEPMNINDDLFKKGFMFAIMLLVTKINEMVTAINYLIDNQK